MTVAVSWLASRRRRARARALGALTLAVAALFPARGARADTDEALRHAQQELGAVGRDANAIDNVVARARAGELTAEQRLVNGELLMHAKDYARATALFSEVIERHPGTPSYMDALWFRGETYFAGKEYLAARRDYAALVDRAFEPRYQSFLGKSLARLVDVSLRLGDVPSLAPVLAKLEQLPPGFMDANLLYAKGKALYLRGETAKAEQAFTSVPNGAVYTHQARYFQGVLAAKGARAQAGGKSAAGNAAAATAFRHAVELFAAVTRLPADTPEHRHVIDLAWMAIGRIHYELDEFREARTAYAKVERGSPEFDAMLYELAWVFVRLGDAQQAQRSLQVLAITNPNSQYLAEGSLLRADLLLRIGSFPQALHIYEGVRDEYDPHRARVEEFLDSSSEPATYYNKLLQQKLDTLDKNERLPQIAIRWAQEAENGPAAFAVIEDVKLSRTLVKRSEELIAKLNALLAASNRVQAFPELLAGQERVLSLLNRLSHGRLELARALDGEEPAQLPEPMEGVRAQRRATMRDIARLPLGQTDFLARQEVGIRQWNKVSQELYAREHEIAYQLQMIASIRRMLIQPPKKGPRPDAAAKKRYLAELDASERELKGYQAHILELRKQVEGGRAQVGVGDVRYQNDALQRAQFRSLLDREVQLADGGRGGGKARAFAQKALPLLASMGRLEDRLVGTFEALEAQVRARSEDIRGKVAAEEVNLLSQRAQLEALDVEARDLVGQVAQRNFEIVRDRLRSIVLRADVGITEQAWEVREEELFRLRRLQLDRARQEQLLDEETREVLDDANGPVPPTLGPATK